MSKYSAAVIRARAEFIQAMIKEGMQEHTAELILRHATTIQRIATAVCSIEMSERETARLERQDKLAEKRIKALCDGAGAGFEPVFGGDPRGACVKIRVPSGRFDSFGGAECGMCVPTPDF